MSKLEDDTVVSIMKAYSEAKQPGEAFDDELAWRLVNDKVEAEKAAQAAAKEKDKDKEKPEQFIMLYDPEGVVPENANICAYNASKIKDVEVDIAIPGEEEREVKAWDEDCQLPMILALADDALMDDNENKYTGKGLPDMVRHGKATMKLFGVAVKGNMKEVLVVRKKDVPTWVNRASAGSKGKS